MISFFTGKTLDGQPFVVSFEGVDTTDSTCRVSGQVGRQISFDFLTHEEGCELVALLPHYHLDEIGPEFASIFLAGQVRRRQRSQRCPNLLEQRETEGGTKRRTFLCLEFTRARSSRCLLKPPANWPRSTPNKPSPAWRWIASGGDIAVFGLCSKCGGYEDFE